MRRIAPILFATVAIAALPMPSDAIARGRLVGIFERD